MSMSYLPRWVPIKVRMIEIDKIGVGDQKSKRIHPALRK